MRLCMAIGHCYYASNLSASTGGWRVSLSDEGFRVLARLADARMKPLRSTWTCCRSAGITWRRNEAGAARELSERVVKVIPRIAALDRELDYIVPVELDSLVTIGTIVRIVVAGRRVSGWVVGEQQKPDPAITLRSILAVTGYGPPMEVVRLAEWAAWRWAGKRTKTLATASPQRVVKYLPAHSRTGNALVSSDRRGLSPGDQPPGDQSARSVALAGRQSRPAAAGPLDGGLLRDIVSSRRGVVRIPPSVGDVSPYLHHLVRSWTSHSGIILSPSVEGARRIADALVQARSARAVLLPGQWAEAASGDCVAVGARSAVWAPVPHIGGIVVLDAHDEAYAEERAPTWNAWMVAAERASRAGVGCTLISACPSLEMLQWGELLTPSRAVERQGWPIIEVVDRRLEDPRLGLVSHRLAGLIRDVLSGAGQLERDAKGQVAQLVCVLNTKGWAALLACAACGELARCEKCFAAVELRGAPPSRAPSRAPGTSLQAGAPGTSLQAGSPRRRQPQEGSQGGVMPPSARELICSRCGPSRPVVCAACSSQRLKVLRSGVSRVSEQLEAIAGTAVPVVTGEDERQATSKAMKHAPVLVGTEALVNRMVAEGRKVNAVVFLDFDRELLVPRVRASERAMTLLAKAARLVRGRNQGGRILVQTRVPDHEVIAAAMRADPGRMVAKEARVRSELKFPPAWAVARISGPGAADFVAGVQVVGAKAADQRPAGAEDVSPDVVAATSGDEPASVEALGPGPNGWLLRARDHETLCNMLSNLRKPAARVRIEVDPIRL